MLRFIPTKSASELVEPYALKDVLLCLKKTGLIAAFKIDHDLTRVETANGRRFEISSFMAEVSNYSGYSTSKRKLGA